MKTPRETEFAILREKACLSPQDVADRTEVSLRTVYRWENGHTKPGRPVLEMLRRLAVDLPDGSPDASFTFIDLFAGIGGMRLGFEAAKAHLFDAASGQRLN